ncbi:hypothetical protein F8388_013005 [Cannabis sativa]|uniref:peroxidase n=1 Tax=Cannabis sativa TaxID=3483 RepID=A0A7J6EBQ2_CANSA|nr:hypothetical protein F8388_013005 [Cannabis sativa]
MKMRGNYITTILLLVSLLAVTISSVVGQNNNKKGGGLQDNFYGKSCKSLEKIVRDITSKKVQADPTLGPKLLRLHYHDCFVRNEKSLWKVFTGRRDGRVSVASEASRDLPSGGSNITTLLNLFDRFGLDRTDLVALSGAHTIGVTHCPLVFRRLYNFTGKGDKDPALDSDFAEELKKICPLPVAVGATTVDLDRRSALTFDSNYFTGLTNNHGVLTSDAALLNDPASAALVKKFGSFKKFKEAFAKSMIKMGAINVLTGNDGEIRKNCRVIN